VAASSLKPIGIQYILGGSIYRIAATYPVTAFGKQGGRESETGIGTGAQEWDTDIDNA
jgi:hypothetical protein